MKEAVSLLHRIHRYSCAASVIAHATLSGNGLPTSERQDTSRVIRLTVRAPSVNDQSYICCRASHARTVTHSTLCGFLAIMRYVHHCHCHSAKRADDSASAHR